jgi:sulfate adenylyltransferase subunit 1 (EFTu-like GTPase family)
MPWYDGPPLLYHLEHVHIASDRNLIDARFPVQWVIRPGVDEHHDFRGYAGQVAGGVLRAGDDVVVLPSGDRTRIASIETFDGPVAEAFPTMSVTIRLEDDLDVSRGDLLCRPQNRPLVERDVDAMLCWMSETPSAPGGRYVVKHATRATRGVLTTLLHRIDVDTLHRDDAAERLQLNEIGRVNLRTAAPLTFDPYARNRTTGSFILIDETTNDTVAAGMVLGAAARDDLAAQGTLTREARWQRLGLRGATVRLIGEDVVPVAEALELRLVEAGVAAYIAEGVHAAALADAGLVVLVADGDDTLRETHAHAGLELIEAEVEGDPQADVDRVWALLAGRGLVSAG